jgi:hypothetical protein
MGEFGKQIVEILAANAITEVVDDQLKTAKILGGIAHLIRAEGAEIANAEQVLEAGCRCLDVVDILVSATTESRTDLDGEQKEEAIKIASHIRRELEELRADLTQP